MSGSTTGRIDLTNRLFVKGHGKKFGNTNEDSNNDDNNTINNDIQLYIDKEWFQIMKHTLVAPKGATLQSIKKVYSHPSALAQCNKLIEKYGFEVIVYYNNCKSI